MKETIEEIIQYKIEDIMRERNKKLTEIGMSAAVDYVKDGMIESYMNNMTDRNFKQFDTEDQTF